MDDDLERLKEHVEQLDELAQASGKGFLRPDYCKEIADILKRHIEDWEDSGKGADTSCLIVNPDFYGEITAPVSAPDCGNVWGEPYKDEHEPVWFGEPKDDYL